MPQNTPKARVGCGGQYEALWAAWAAEDAEDSDEEDEAPAAADVEAQMTWTTSEPTTRKGRVVKLVGVGMAAVAICGIGALTRLALRPGSLAVAAEPKQAHAARGLLAFGDESAVDSRGWAGAGKCGIATNLLDFNQAGMEAFCSMDLDFWWNRGPTPRNDYNASCAEPKFIPAIWGSHPENKRAAYEAGERFGTLLGYNEPDRWGSAPHSSGAQAATFHCGSHELAQEWRGVVMAYREARPLGVIASPAVADLGRRASTGGRAGACNDSPQSVDRHLPSCPGWLRCFKENVLQFDCGGVNCWDSIDVLQFHAFEYDADKLIEKVKTWETLWADELRGTNGRRQKTLWLTEFAHAGTDSEDLDGTGVAFMEKSLAYLQRSSFVSGWSWFSQTFTSFEIDGLQPSSKYWSTELINGTGHVTKLGQRYQELCAKIPHSPFEFVAV